VAAVFDDIKVQTGARVRGVKSEVGEMSLSRNCNGGLSISDPNISAAKKDMGNMGREAQFRKSWAKEVLLRVAGLGWG